MRDTRLILMDGLPGAGKSTTSERLLERLGREDVPAHLLPERQEGHPLNVGGDLHPSGSTTGEALFARYTVEAFARESLERWSVFAARAARQPAVHILDGYPFQNSARVLLQMDAGFERIVTYAAAVEAVMESLRPVLVYLETADPEASLRAICAQRGPAWTEYAVAVITRCPYAAARGLSGFDGALALMRAYQELLDTLLARVPFPLLRVEDCAGRWAERFARVERFLSLD